VLLFTKIHLGLTLAEKAFFIGPFLTYQQLKIQRPTNKSPSLKDFWVQAYMACPKRLSDLGNPLKKYSITIPEYDISDMLQPNS
jgi:hypothetical protein